MATKKMTMGLIVGNRGFFPDHLAKSGREEMLRVLQAAGMDVVALTPEESKYGAVETREESRRCADLFRRNRDRIDGVIVTLPNFGEERAIADALRLADLHVPVLIQATPDDPSKMTIAFRRDSFCGKMSACNNLRQYNIPYSLTTLHTVDPGRPEFVEDVRRFAATCRVVRKFKNARVGAIGARPGAFNTVRYSEKLLEHSGITVETLDLSEILGAARGMADDNQAVKDKIAAIQGLCFASRSMDQVFPMPLAVKKVLGSTRRAAPCGHAYTQLGSPIPWQRSHVTALVFTTAFCRPGLSGSSSIV